MIGSLFWGEQVTLDPDAFQAGAKMEPCHYEQYVSNQTGQRDYRL